MGYRACPNVVHVGMSSPRRRVSPIPSIGSLLRMAFEMDPWDHQRGVYALVCFVICVLLWFLFSLIKNWLAMNRANGTRRERHFLELSMKRWKNAARSTFSSPMRFRSTRDPRRTRRTTAIMLPTKVWRKRLRRTSSDRQMSQQALSQ